MTLTSEELDAALDRLLEHSEERGHLTSYNKKNVANYKILNSLRKYKLTFVKHFKKVPQIDCRQVGQLSGAHNGTCSRGFFLQHTQRS